MVGMDTHSAVETLGLVMFWAAGLYAVTFFVIPVLSSLLVKAGEKLWAVVSRMQRDILEWEIARRGR